MTKNNIGKLSLFITNEVLGIYSEADVLILVSDYLEGRKAPQTITRINYDLLIEPIASNRYKVILF